MANTICNNDGGALASVLTQDDRSALDYYLQQTTKLVYVGLKKIEDITCSNNACDGKLRWQNGKTFKFDSLIHNEVLVDGSNDKSVNCFRMKYDKQNINDRNCDFKSHFLCQIACPGESKFIKII